MQVGPIGNDSDFAPGSNLSWDTDCHHSDPSWFLSGSPGKCWDSIDMRGSVTIDGVWILEYISHLYTRLGTTRTYSAIANLHHSEITTAIPLNHF
jgi:hypothetical protein